MPGVYREKSCPTCNKNHRKKGMFCSKICSNKGRDEEYRQKMRERMLYTDEGQERVWNLTWGEDSEPILPQVGKGPDRNQFVQGGDIWTVVDD
jgi:predicted nucleic acid-binding Zn ribbon protein